MPKIKQKPLIKAQSLAYLHIKKNFKILVDKGVPDAKKALDELNQKMAEVPVKAT